MLDNFIYENHLGKKFVGLENDTFMNYSDLRDYEWSYDTINNRIARFYKSPKNRKIPLIVHCKTEEEAIDVKNKLYEIAETDVEALQQGKIYIGDYYTKGYITASSKSNFLISKRLCQFTLTLTSDDVSWYRETEYSFLANSENEISNSIGADYPYDFTYDYVLSQNGKKINCDSVCDNEFKILIYGAVENPTIAIGGYNYKVNGSVKKGEKLLIDSISKTITLITATGTKTNFFDNRNRQSYIFRPIKPGQQTVSWNGTFDFDLTIIEKRSEPKWT